MGYIYLFSRVDDNCPVYVGQHDGSNHKYFTGGKILNRSYKKNKDSFWFKYEKQIITQCDNDKLNELEVFYIKKYNTYKNGYNLTIGGDATRGYKHTEKTKELLSKKKKGSKLSAETIEKIRKIHTGSKRSKETKFKISEAQKGRVFSEETIRKMSIAKGNMSIETRDKMSKSHKGKVLSETHKANISKSSMGRLHSDESKDKIRQSKIGKKRSKEVIENISKGKKGLKQVTVKCPFCCKVGGVSNMRRYHFDKCSNKK